MEGVVVKVFKINDYKHERVMHGQLTQVTSQQYAN